MDGLRLVGRVGGGVLMGRLVTPVEREEMLVLARLNLPEAIAVRFTREQVQEIWWQQWPPEADVLWQALCIV